MWTLPIALLWASCAPATVISPVDAPIDPTAPTWSEERARLHLEALDGRQLEGRGTASAGFNRAASHLSTHLRESGIEPAGSQGYWAYYGLSIALPTDATVEVGFESLPLTAGLDFWPDPMTSGGTRLVRALMAPPDGPLDVASLGLAGLSPDEIAVLTTVPPTPEMLENWVSWGVRTVWIEGELSPGLSDRAKESLIILQFAPDLSAQLRGTLVPTTVPTMLTEPIWVDLTVYREPNARALNVVGYLGGNHPFLRQEGVVVITDMDGMGSPGGLTVASPRDVPFGAVALLNVLDHLSMHAVRTGWNQRTLITLFASGGIVGHAGVRAYARTPAWPIDQTTDVVYVGRDTEISALLHETFPGAIVHLLHPNETEAWLPQFVIEPQRMRAWRDKALRSRVEPKTLYPLDLPSAIQITEQLSDSLFHTLRPLIQPKPQPLVSPSEPPLVTLP